jgi:pyruvate dehydrogenase E1 component beta subunit
LRVTGFDTPFPYTLEHESLPDADRILDAVERVVTF